MKSKLKVAPKNSKNRKTYLESFGKSEVEINIFDNSDIDLVIGENVSDETEQVLVKAILDKGYEELNKAITYQKVLQGSCTCGAHKVKSEGHYDWCDGLRSRFGLHPSTFALFPHDSKKLRLLHGDKDMIMTDGEAAKYLSGHFSHDKIFGDEDTPGLIWNARDGWSSANPKGRPTKEELDQINSMAKEMSNRFKKSAREEMIEYLEKKKQWSPKAKHKSDKGGLTAAGRASYNKATGGNLKAPQPGGGPRKRSFCARNGGQIRMHGIDCKKTPDKRACKARRRWKC